MADGFGDFLSGLGSGISGAISGAGDWLSGLFGGGGGGAEDLGTRGASALGEAAGGGGGYSTTPGYVASGIPGTSMALDTAGGGGGGGGFMGFLKDVGSGVGDVAKGALPFAQLGTAGMGIASGISGMMNAAEQNKILKQQQRQQQAMAAPAAAAGAELTSAGKQSMLGGPLPPQLEQQAQQFEDQLRMQYRQYLSSIGQTDSTAAIQMEGVIKQQAAAYREQLAQQLLSSGYQGIGTALGPSQAVSGTAAQLAGAGAGTMSGANAALSKLLASG